MEYGCGTAVSKKGEGAGKVQGASVFQCESTGTDPPHSPPGETNSEPSRLRPPALFQGGGNQKKTNPCPLHPFCTYITLELCLLFKKGIKEAESSPARTELNLHN
ncbi:hypothetical protein KIL84_015706 [Mauremys mutica]|uniref:Uncharacterized protein n=1 Tax=Mauremys mutica TaxID=74926 RepID=A0A9D3WR97_9SAUR|nr:hypothetical protein KIL84_015706 [Mauremys mutica]